MAKREDHHHPGSRPDQCPRSGRQARKEGRHRRAGDQGQRHPRRGHLRGRQGHEGWVLPNYRYQHQELLLRGPGRHQRREHQVEQQHHMRSDRLHGERRFLPDQRLQRLGAEQIASGGCMSCRSGHRGQGGFLARAAFRDARSRIGRPHCKEGGAGTVDHLRRGEGRCRVHAEMLGVGTDGFESQLENVENKTQTSKSGGHDGSRETSETGTETSGNTTATTADSNHTSRQIRGCHTRVVRDTRCRPLLNHRVVCAGAARVLREHDHRPGVPGSRPG
jgi:hypothetical protein